MAKHKWVMIKPGTVVHGTGWKNEGNTHTFTDEESKIRYCLSEQYTSLQGRGQDLGYYWVVIHKGNSWVINDIKTSTVEIKIPPMKKEFVTLAVKNSEWEFERDWTFNGWGNDRDAVYTIPAGTRIKLVDDKLRLEWYNSTEKCLICEPDPAVSMFHVQNYVRGGGYAKIVTHAAIPAKEASNYLKLVTAGKVKTYWKMEDSEGNAFVDKRFATLGNLKSSLRVRFGLVKEDRNNEDESAPYWIAYDGFKRPDTDKGVFAVEYEHATNKELTRQDMSKFLVVSFLKA